MKKSALIIGIIVVLSITCSFTFIESSEYLKLETQTVFAEETPLSLIPQKRIEKREVPDFSEINLSVSADVYLSQGSSTELEVQASDKTLKNLETYVKNDALIIKWDNNNYNNGEVIIKITMKKIEGLKIAGSGNIIANSAINCNDLDLEIAGSGDITLKEISVKEIESQIAGSGNIKLGGNHVVESHEINIAGSGDVSAKKLETAIVEVNIAGSGDCYVHAREKLNVNIVGSGDVYYYGDAHVSSNIQGSGDITRL